MADTATAAAPTADAAPAKATKKRASGAAKTKKATASHPTYQQMIKMAIVNLKEPKGSSKAAILKYIVQHYKVGNNLIQINGHLRLALNRAVSSGFLKQVKGHGASGSFRLGDKAKKATGEGKKKKKRVSKKKATGTPKKAAKPKKARKSKSPKAKATKAKKTKSPKKPKSPKKAKSPKKTKKAKSPKKAKTAGAAAKK